MDSIFPLPNPSAHSVRGQPGLVVLLHCPRTCGDAPTDAVSALDRPYSIGMLAAVSTILTSTASLPPSITLPGSPRSFSRGSRRSSRRRVVPSQRHGHVLACCDAADRRGRLPGESDTASRPDHREGAQSPSQVQARLGTFIPLTRPREDTSRSSLVSVHERLLAAEAENQRIDVLVTEVNKAFDGAGDTMSAARVRGGTRTRPHHAVHRTPRY
jgi:hypothetical protein